MDYTLAINFDNEQMIWTVKVSGEIDIFNSYDFKGEISALIDREAADVVLDCGDLSYIDSTALGALMTLKKAAEQRERNLTLTNVNPNIQRLLAITNLDKIF